MAKHRKGRQAHRTSINTQRSKSANTANHWTWLMTGMLIGILGIIIIFIYVTGKWPLDKFRITSPIRTSNTLMSTHTAKKNSSKPNLAKMLPVKTTTQKKEPARFEFYQLLPGMEVPLPDPTPETASSSNKSVPLFTNKVITPKPAETNQTFTLQQTSIKPTFAKIEKKLAAAHYLLQAGTFRRLEKAESLKKRLQLQGLSAKIQKIEAEDGIWFRVTLGPFSSETLALRQKSRLAQEKIPSVLILQRQ
jgi:cell division protein FtsN